MKYFEIINERTDKREEVGKELRKHVGKNALISFTVIDKLGINPKSGYDTPIGIYTYPLDQKIDDIESLGTEDGVEYMGDSPYLWVMVPKEDARILNLDDYRNRTRENDTEKLIEYARSQNISIGRMKTLIDESIKNALVHSPGGYIWAISMNLAKEIIKNRPVKEYQAHHTGPADPTIVLWNKLLRDVLNYDIVLDLGDGIIHSAEKKQAVILNPRSIRVIDKFDFTRNEEQDFFKTVKHYLSKKNNSAQSSLIPPSVHLSRAYSKLKNPSTAAKRALISASPSSINVIKNPPLQLAKLALATIANINNGQRMSLEDLQIAVINNSPSSIATVMRMNPSKRVQLAAVEKDPYYIETILDAKVRPDEEVFLKAVSNPSPEYENVLYTILNQQVFPSEKVQIAAVKTHPNSIHDLTATGITISDAVKAAAQK